MAGGFVLNKEESKIEILQEELRPGRFRTLPEISSTGFQEYFGIGIHPLEITVSQSGNTFTFDVLMGTQCQKLSVHIWKNLINRDYILKCYQELVKHILSNHPNIDGNYLRILVTMILAILKGVNLFRDSRNYQRHLPLLRKLRSLMHV